jgi:hypothetical protein
MYDASVLSEAHGRTSACDDNALRAFDKTVRRNPLAFAVDAVYGNSIDLELEVIAKKGVARKACLLMLVNVLLPAFTPVMVRRGCSSFKRRYACITRGSVRRASGFVLTGNTELPLVRESLGKNPNIVPMTCCFGRDSLCAVG